MEELETKWEIVPQFIQVEAHPYFTQKELRVTLDKYGIKLMSWYPLGHGDTALMNELVFAGLGKKYGKTPAQVILRWHTQMGFVVIPGSKNAEHIKDNMDIFDFALTDEEMEQIPERTQNPEQTAEKIQNPKQVQNVEQSQNNPVVFKEALIEKAVRKELNLSETDTITASMLEDVRKLRIVGKEILEDEDSFWGEGHHVDGKDSSFGSVRGDIKDLSDLAQMTNLEELALCNQEIEDISGLKELPLKKLYLSKNMITDFSVLPKLIDLDILCIMENPAEDLSPVGECTGISRLNIQGMNLTDIDFLKNLKLDYLDMSNAEIKNNIFEPLAEMKKLDTLCMCDINEAAAETLSKLSTLKALFMWGDSTKLENLKPLKGMEKLDTLAFTTQISSLEGIEQFPSLNFLSVSFSLVKDLSPITGAENLQTIDISNAEIENYEPLLECTGLKEVRCSEEQKQEILKLNSFPDFEIYT